HQRVYQFRNPCGNRPRYAMELMLIPTVSARATGTAPANRKPRPSSQGRVQICRGIMNRTCRAAGCWAPAGSRFAAYCGPHRAALRRHGAVDQKALTKAQLKPYLKLVKKRIAKNPENIAWVALDESWRALVDHAEGILAYFTKGKAGSRFERV